MFRVGSEPAWKMYECGKGTRWTSVMHDIAGEICNFSGCNCNTRVKQVGITTEVNEASKWFRRPNQAIG